MIKRLAIAAGIALTVLVVAPLIFVRGDPDEDEPVPTPDLVFSDGLSAEEIFDRYETTDLLETNVHTRITKTRDFLGDRQESSTEAFVIGEDVYSIKSEAGEPAREVLLYEDQFYLRDSGEATWERTPEVDQVSQVMESVREAFTLPESEPEPDLVRVSNATVDGRTMMRVSLPLEVEGDEVADYFGAAFGALADEFPIPTPPRELLPDRIAGEFTWWIGAEDFLLYRFDLRVEAFIGEQLFLSSIKSTEILERGVTEFPIALPD